IPRLSERIPTPPAADAVIARAMAKNPTDRYPTCHDFTTDLRQALLSPGAAPDGGRSAPTLAPSPVYAPTVTPGSTMIPPGNPPTQFSGARAGLPTMHGGVPPRFPHFLGAPPEPVGPPQSPQRFTRRRAAVVSGVIGSVMLLVAAVTGVAIWSSGGDDEPDAPIATSSVTPSPAADFSG
ncbi:serine/threonine protein kinase, partial [Gordonia sp. VNQ95]